MPGRMVVRKVLFVATVVKTHIMAFHVPYLQLFKEMGWETTVAARNDYDDPVDCVIPYCDTYYNVPFERRPFKFGNVKAYKELKRVIDNGEYDIIHCHTPVGSVLTRLAARRARERGSKVIYTAHGFHFYRGAPVINWLLYYPIEKICAHFTDVLITINREDYILAQKRMKAKSVKYVPGVGIDTQKFSDPMVDRTAKRAELGISDDAIFLLSVGELSKRKNHETAIRALSIFSKSAIYCIAGEGSKKRRLQEIARRLNVAEQVMILGYRNDIAELCAAADVFVFPSFHEGLSVALMEAMASGLPCVVSRVRGNTDLIVDSKGGYLCAPTDAVSFANALKKFPEDDTLRRSMRKYNLVRIKDYDIAVIQQRMKEIYDEVCNIH